MARKGVTESQDPLTGPGRSRISITGYSVGLLAGLPSTALQGVGTAEGDGPGRTHC